MLWLVACSALYVPVEQSVKEPNSSVSEALAEIDWREEAVVERVESGDRFTLADGRTFGYLGVLAPRPGEPFFAETLAANGDLLEGKRVTLLFVEGGDPHHVYVLVSADQYADTDAQGFVFANLAMIASGSAQVAPSPRRLRFLSWFLQAEAAAREAKRGIWQGRRGD
jgi:endonuclease YncB( thermonuclease family)